MANVWEPIFAKPMLEMVKLRSPLFRVLNMQFSQGLPGRLREPTHVGGAHLQELFLTPFRRWTATERKFEGSRTEGDMCGKAGARRASATRTNKNKSSSGHSLTGRLKAAEEPETSTGNLRYVV